MASMATSRPAFAATAPEPRPPLSPRRSSRSRLPQAGSRDAASAVRGDPMIVRPTPKTRITLLALSLAFAGCGSEDADANVVVGLTTDMAVGFDMHEIERTTRVD